MIEKLAPWLVGIGIVCFFPFLSWLLAVAGGWHRLAMHYATWQPAEGEIHRFQSASFGWVNYGSCLTIVLCSYGMRLAVSPFFRLCHPPLLIPWSEFHEIRERRSFLVKQDEVTIGNPVISRLSLDPRILRSAREKGYVKAELRSRHQPAGSNHQ
jgi:hypothetical protein